MASSTNKISKSVQRGISGVESNETPGAGDYNNPDSKQKRELRRESYDFVTSFLWGNSALILFVVVLQGGGAFNLSTPVLISYIVSSNGVVALMGYILKGLYKIN